nr:hypothetical protein [Tanacetum cinerariifolium]
QSVKSDVTTAMTAILKQFQATPPPASVKVVEEIYITCGGAHSYYQCLTADGNTFPEVRDNIQGYETLTDPNLSEYTIKVPPPPVKKYKPSSQRYYVVHQMDLLYPNIPYPSRMLKQKQQEKDEVQIYKFWKMFKKLHINITITDALILMPNELKCKALADLGDSINLMPLSVWKKLGLPELIFTRMTLELANRAIFTLAEIARDVFVPVGKFTFPADFVIVDYESDPRVPLILRRPFLRTAHALIDVHGEEMILRDGEIVFLLHQDIDSSLKDWIDQSNLANPANNFFDSMPEMFTDEHALDYSSPLIFDEYDDECLEVEFDAKNVYDDPFNPKGEKIKESKLLIDELDLPCDFLPPSKYDSFISQDFSRVDAKPSTNNEYKVFNPDILN